MCSVSNPAGVPSWAHIRRGNLSSLSSDGVWIKRKINPSGEPGATKVNRLSLLPPFKKELIVVFRRVAYTLRRVTAHKKRKKNGKVSVFCVFFSVLRVNSGLFQPTIAVSKHSWAAGDGWKKRGREGGETRGYGRSNSTALRHKRESCCEGSSTTLSAGREREREQEEEEEEDEEEGGGSLSFHLKITLPHTYPSLSPERLEEQQQQQQQQRGRKELIGRSVALGSVFFFFLHFFFTFFKLDFSARLKKKNKKNKTTPWWSSSTGKNPQKNKTDCDRNRHVKERVKKSERSSSWKVGIFGDSSVYPFKKNNINNPHHVIDLLHMMSSLEGKSLNKTNVIYWLFFVCVCVCVCVVLICFACFISNPREPHVPENKNVEVLKRRMERVCVERKTRASFKSEARGGGRRKIE